MLSISRTLMVGANGTSVVDLNAKTNGLSLDSRDLICLVYQIETEDRQSGLQTELDPAAASPMALFAQNPN